MDKYSFPVRSFLDKFILLLPLLTGSCNGSSTQASQQEVQPNTFAATPTQARTPQGEFISWKEHLIDDVSISGVAISGSDGLVMADLDLDGFEDIISVHESDTEYDGVPEGHIRIAFGSQDPDQWELVTLAEGAEAGAPEDVAVDDLNGDGYPDIMAACELAHLIYFQNPGKAIRTTQWERLIPSITKNRGSFIRVFFADFNQDGRPEVTAPNKGKQTPGMEGPPNPISWFEVKGDPLQDEAWTEHELKRVKIPINSQPVDLDQDGDLDIIGGSRGQGKIYWFENLGTDPISFREHPIKVAETVTPVEKRTATFKDWEETFTSGFNMDFYDFNQDGRLDILLAEFLFTYLIWLEQPLHPEDTWVVHSVGDMYPESLVGFVLGDINGDRLPDIMAGSYSQGARAEDGEVKPTDALGRLAWFEHPGDLKQPWKRHDISRRKRGMFDKFIVRDMDKDGDMDFVGTRGNSVPYDGVFWLEQVRTNAALPSFERARKVDSEEVSHIGN